MIFIGKTCKLFPLPAAPRSVLPLSLRWKTIDFASFITQQPYVLLSIIPTYILNRTLVAASLEVRRITAHDINPILLCHFIFPHIKIIYADIMHRFFIFLSIPKGISHIETTSFYKSHSFELRHLY